jgi:uncharacterized protein (TIGR03435 family)
MRATSRMFRMSRAVMTVPTLFVILAMIEGRGQTPNEQLPITAPATLQFEAAAIRENKGGLSPSNATTANVGMNNGEGSPPADSSFSVTNMRLIILLRFAYKLSFFQETQLKGQLPDWALKDSFDIRARATETPTKDQMRIMVRYLLEDRFKLAIHTEVRQTSALALELAKPGKMGPHLRSHPSDSACTTSPTANSERAGIRRQSKAAGDELPEICGEILTDLVRPAGSTLPITHVAARGVSIAQIAQQAQLWTMQLLPVVDRTGSSGTFDFTLSFVADGGGCSDGVCAATDSQPEQSGPSLAQAMKEQLGLKLVPTKAPSDFIVLDKIDYPSDN